MKGFVMRALLLTMLVTSSSLAMYRIPRIVRTANFLSRALSTQFPLKEKEREIKRQVDANLREVSEGITDYIFNREKDEAITPSEFKSRLIEHWPRTDLILLIREHDELKYGKDHDNEDEE